MPHFSIINLVPTGCVHHVMYRQSSKGADEEAEPTLEAQCSDGIAQLAESFPINMPYCSATAKLAPLLSVS